MDGKNETGRNKIKAHYSESSKFRQSPCLAEQGFPILASFPLRRPPHPRKMGEGAVSGGARHGTLTKKGAGGGLAERIGKPCLAERVAWIKSLRQSEKSSVPVSQRWQIKIRIWRRSNPLLRESKCFQILDTRGCGGPSRRRERTRETG